MQVALEHLELLPKILEKLTLIEKKLEDSQSKRWMNVKELGKYLGYSADHVYKLKEKKQTGVLQSEINKFEAKSSNPGSQNSEVV